MLGAAPCMKPASKSWGEPIASVDRHAVREGTVSMTPQGWHPQTPDGMRG